jgi:hypothetical protein
VPKPNKGTYIQCYSKKRIKTLKIKGFYEDLDSSAGLAAGGYFIQFGDSSRKRMRMETPYEPDHSINLVKNGNPFDSSISQMFS